jgi:hypothetical protein
MTYTRKLTNVRGFQPSNFNRNQFNSNRKRGPNGPNRNPQRSYKNNGNSRQTQRPSYKNNYQQPSYKPNPNRKNNFLSHGEIDAINKIVQKTLSAFLKGERHQSAARKAVAYPKQDAQRPRGNAQQTSSNPEFREQVRSTNAYFRLRNAADNWTQLPRTLDQQLAKFSTSIKPPLATVELQEELTALTTDYKKRIVSKVTEHLESMMQIKLADIANGNVTDYHLIEQIAWKQASNQNKNKKMTSSKRAAAMDDINLAINSVKQNAREEVTFIADSPADGDFILPARTSRPRSPIVQTVETSNHYGILAEADQINLEAAMDILNNTMAAVDNVTTNPQRKRTRDTPGQSSPENAQRTKAPRQQTPITRDVPAQSPKAARTAQQANDPQGEVKKPSYAEAVSKNIHTTDDAQEGTSDDPRYTGSSTRRNSDPGTSSIKSNTGHGPVYSYMGSERSRWSAFHKLEANTTTVVIADSNGRRWENIPEDWIVHAFSGAKLNDAIDLLESIQIPTQILNIVLALGINNRDAPSDDITRCITKLNDFRQRTTFTVKFLMVPQHPNFTPEQANNIAHLNRTARDLFGTDFIVGPPRQLIQPLMIGEAAHYTKVTADRIIELIKPHMAHLN